MKSRAPLIVFALFMPLAFGAWKWSRALEERFLTRLEQPQPLQITLAKHVSGTDAFTLVSGITSDLTFDAHSVQVGFTALTRD